MKTQQWPKRTPVKPASSNFRTLYLERWPYFWHVGSQVTGINTVIGYAQSLGLPLLEAKVFPSYILGITMLGFLLGIALIPKFINHLNVLRVCTTSAIVLTLLFFIVQGQVTFLGHTADPVHLGPCGIGAFQFINVVGNMAACA